MHGASLQYFKRVSDIVGEFCNLDFKTAIVFNGNQPSSNLPKMILCVGESSWSCCVMITIVFDEDPIIQLLADDGSDVTSMCWNRQEVRSEVLLSVLTADYLSVKELLDSENHRNERLASASEKMKKQPVHSN